MKISVFECQSEDSVEDSKRVQLESSLWQEKNSWICSIQAMIEARKLIRSVARDMESVQVSYKESNV